MPPEVETSRKAGASLMPPACERCEKAKKLQIHHADYEKPLMVRWLCSACHPIEDRTRRMKYPLAFRNGALITLNLYLPTAAKKRDIKRKAKNMGKSVSQIVLDHFDSLPTAK